MGLLTFIKIPCHHVLTNEIALNLNYRIGLKHFFNINLGIGIIKKLLFLFVFSTYLPVFLLNFWSREFVGCGIKFHIQQVSTRHTFDGPRYPKTKKYLKKCDDNVIIMFFRVFLVFWVVRFVKSMQSGYSLDAEFNSASREHIIIMFFQVFLVFGVEGSVKSMQCGYSLDAESNSASNELSWSKFE